MNFFDILPALKAELKSRFNLDVSVVFQRRADVSELSSRRVMIQPASMAVERSVDGDRVKGRLIPRKKWVVDVISEEHVEQEYVEGVAQARVSEFENIAQDLTRRPFVSGVYCLNAQTFDDAPAGINAEILENGYALVLSGLRLTLIED